jgi:transmembrane protein EpsG
MILWGEHMNQYISILLWLGFIALLINQRDFTRLETVCGKEEYRYSWIFALIVFAPIVWMAGHRGWFADTTAYIMGYLSTPQSLTGIAAYLASVKKDKGFYVLSLLLKCIFGSDYVSYLTALAVFQGISIVVFYRKYSTHYVLSIFLFIASTDYISWMFNGLRQFMAVTIILFAVPFMLEKKYVQAILIILLASTMHQSALIMIPFVFIAQGEVWNKKTVAFIALALLAVVYVDSFTDILEDTLSTTQYSTVVSDYTLGGDDGTNPLRVALYSVPAILALVGRQRIIEEDNKIINFSANMSIISMGLYIVSMVTSGIYIGRLPIYCSLFGYILLPWELDNLFMENSKQITKIAAIVAYLVFYYYQMHTSWGMF